MLSQQMQREDIPANIVTKPLVQALVETGTKECTEMRQELNVQNAERPSPEWIATDGIFQLTLVRKASVARNAIQHLLKNLN